MDHHQVLAVACGTRMGQPKGLQARASPDIALHSPLLFMLILRFLCVSGRLQAAWGVGG